MIGLPVRSSHALRTLTGAGGLTAVAAILTLLIAAPVLEDPTRRLFGSEIVGRHPDPFVVISQLLEPRPLGLFTQPATDWTGAALAAVLGSGVAAYNALVLLTFPLAALFAYLLAHHLIGSRPAAWLAGLVYAFAPFHLAHAAYHPHVAQTQWLPLYLLALLLACQRASPVRLLLLAGSAALAVLSNFYYGLILAVLTPVLLVGFWIFVARGGEERSRRDVAVTAAALVGMAAAGLGYVYAFAPQVLERPEALAFPRQDLFLYSARWWSYLAPPVEHPLLGVLTARLWRGRPIDGLLEQQLTAGAGLLALALVGARLGWRRDGVRRGAVPLLLLVGAAAFLCSLAPEWRILGISLPRPSGLFYALLPIFRAYARFGLVVILVLAILGGLGAVALWRRPGRERLLAVALLATAALELTPLPPWRWRDVLPTSAHRFLSERGPPVRLLDCAEVGRPGDRSIAALFEGEISLSGRRRDCGQPGIGGVLAAEGYTHMLVRGKSRLGRWLRGRPAPEGLAPIGAFEDALLFEVSAEAPPFTIDFGAGFSWREFKGTRSYRWMGEEGRLWIEHRGSKPSILSLELTLHAFPRPRTVEVLLRGQPQARLEISTRIDAYRVGPFELPPGRHELLLRPLEPAVVADKVLHNGDLRPLSIAVWDWRSVE